MKLQQVALLFLTFSCQSPHCLAEGCNPTSLEIALNKAFNVRVEDGTYATIFGELTNVKAGSFCSGSSDLWPIPKAERDSDLKRVLRRNKFLCGYNSDNVWFTPGGELLLDTTGGSASGAIAEWWDEIGKEMGRLYNRKNLKVEWKLFENSQATLDGVQSGEVDAACGRWALDGFWVDGMGETVPRALALSSQHCVTYLEQGQIYTLKKSSDIASFPDMIEGIESGEVTSVCVVGSVNGGTSQSCTSIISQYTKVEIVCSGEREQAFPKLDNGSCDAVWGGAPDVQKIRRYNSFDQPSLYAAGTLFRREDLDVAKK